MFRRALTIKDASICGGSQKKRPQSAREQISSAATIRSLQHDCIDFAPVGSNITSLDLDGIYIHL